MIRFIFSSILLVMSLTVQLSAQQTLPVKRPLLVPFQVNGEYGLMDTLGNEVKAPGFCASVKVYGDFSYYVIMDKDAKDNYMYWLMDTQTGKPVNMGTLKDSSPLIIIDDIAYYHFEKDNKTVIASPVNHQSFTLDKIYSKVEAFSIYDSKRNNKTQYLAVYDTDRKGTIISVADQFRKVTTIPSFEKLELISGTLDEGYLRYTFPVGFAVDEIAPKEAPVVPVKAAVKSKTRKSNRLEPPEAIKPPEMYNSTYPDENWKAVIYDNQLVRKGESLTTDSALTSLFGVKVRLSRNIPGDVSVGLGIIKAGMGGNQGEELNDEFAIRQLTKEVSGGAYREIHYFGHINKDNTFTELISQDDAQFTWAYQNKSPLLSIRYYKEGGKVTAYFDFNGVVLPKNKLMVPAKYYTGSMSPYLF
ncbi:hypothetical protein ACFU8T_16075 [Sphingobacterium spiritivorum]|nr:hypothetical protein [Sphingobacterium spiritivorum]WQD33744.1 hypothetical protein U0038_19735 [Sphingobacterium spiritivorum]SUJ26473.1 Uncharacterised protein [Sphingobacterium spiritivorum]